MQPAVASALASADETAVVAATSARASLRLQVLLPRRTGCRRPAAGRLQAREPQPPPLRQPAALAEAQARLLARQSQATQGVSSVKEPAGLAAASQAQQSQQESGCFLELQEVAAPVVTFAEQNEFTDVIVEKNLREVSTAPRSQSKLSKREQRQEPPAAPPARPGKTPPEAPPFCLLQHWQQQEQWKNL